MFAEEATAAVEGYSRQVADAVVEKAQKLCAVHGKEKGEMKVEVKVSVGDARSVICEMVDKLGADVLVSGDGEPWLRPLQEVTKIHCDTPHYFCSS
jgi:nucleotide-binding universal stress UspA family protein